MDGLSSTLLPTTQDYLEAVMVWNMNQLPLFFRSTLPHPPLEAVDKFLLCCPLSDT